MRLLVTGGCGFVGNNFIHCILNHYDPEFITNVDALTRAGPPRTTADFLERFGDDDEFVQADFADATDEVYGSAKERRFTEAHASG